MGRKPFQRSYAQWYDFVYSDKDYEKECDYLESLFGRFAAFKPRHVLDISCGTGGHAIPLARRGYEITASDSSGDMLRVAKEKAKGEGVRVSFRRADMRSFSFGTKYDVCVSMFDSIDYLPSIHGLQQAFVNVSQHLESKGLFIFQFWNGLAVMRDWPKPKMKTIKKDDTEIIRYVEPKMRLEDQACELNYSITVLKKRRIVEEFGESHLNHFYFPNEIDFLLSITGFNQKALLPFMKLTPKAGEDDWSVICVAQKSSD